MYFDDIGMREKASSIGFSYKSFEPPLNILIRLFSILRYSVVLGTLYKILGEILLDSRLSVCAWCLQPDK